MAEINCPAKQQIGFFYFKSSVIIKNMSPCVKYKAIFSTRNKENINNISKSVSISNVMAGTISLIGGIEITFNNFKVCGTHSL